MLNDELVGVDGTEDGQVSTTTSKEESWATTHVEELTELQAMSKTRRVETQKSAKSTDLVLEEELPKGIRCLNGRITPPLPDHTLVLEENERNTAALFSFECNTVQIIRPTQQLDKEFA